MSEVVTRDEFVHLEGRVSALESEVSGERSLTLSTGPSDPICSDSSKAISAVVGIGGGGVADVEHPVRVPGHAGCGDAVCIEGVRR